MVDLTQPEIALVEQLLDILEETIDETPDIELEYANKTKIQKLLYFAIDEFDIPVTHSWYLAGAVVPDRSIGPSAFTNTPTPTQPSVPDPDATTETDTSSHDPLDPILFTDDDDEDFEDNAADLEAYVPRDELVAFYQEVIPTVWHERTMRFLQNFYKETAPGPYRNLYIESTHLRTHLTDLRDAVQSHSQNDPPAKSITAIREPIELSISDLHFYLQQNERLGQTFNAVVSGTDLLEDALMMLDQTDTETLTEAHVATIDSLQDFFYYYVWKYPCLLISIQTATGPQADALRAEHRETFETFDQVLQDERATVAAELADVDLLPGPNDYKPIDDTELAETLSNLSTEYLE